MGIEFPAPIGEELARRSAGMEAGFGCRGADGQRGGRLLAPTVFFGVLVVSLAVVLAVAGLAVVPRVVPFTLRE